MEIKHGRTRFKIKNAGVSAGYEYGYFTRRLKAPGVHIVGCGISPWQADADLGKRLFEEYFNISRTKELEDIVESVTDVPFPWRVVRDIGVGFLIGLLAGASL
jgi:hypothetical protein